MTTEQVYNRLTELDLAEKLAFEDKNMANWSENYGIIMKSINEKIEIVKQHINNLKNAN